MSDEKGIMAEIYTRGIHFGKPGPCRLVNQQINNLLCLFKVKTGRGEHNKEVEHPKLGNI